jgi:NAD(P)-dependent dehydrogenase (short-subunit alcohol dehydrogenase family)
VRKKVLITGGDNGLGENLTRNFAKENYDVYLTYNESIESAKKIKEDLEKAYYKKLEKNYIKFNNQEDSLMDELRHALGELYEEFGHTEVTQRLSEILDEYIAIQQRENLECYKQLQEQRI